MYLQAMTSIFSLLLVFIDLLLICVIYICNVVAFIVLTQYNGVGVQLKTNSIF